MKISVIIPSYNHEAYIKQAINSVLNQTHKNLELIVVDDGSTDDSCSIIEDFSDKRLKLIKQKNKGAHAAINKGFENSTGEYITILNSDDLFTSQRLEIMLEQIQKEDAGFASTWIEVIDENGNQKGVKKAWENMLPWEPESFIEDDTNRAYIENLFFSNFISTTSNMMISREVLSKGFRMRGFRFVHDWDFALRVANKFHCIVIDKPLIKYRLHDSNTIKTDNNWMIYEIMLVLAANIEIAASKVFKFDNSENLIKSISRFNNLLAYQGNERLFITFQSLIRNMKDMGVNNPVEFILSKKELRMELFKYMRS